MSDVADVPKVMHVEDLVAIMEGMENLKDAYKTLPQEMGFDFGKLTLIEITQLVGRLEELRHFYPIMAGNLLRDINDILPKCGPSA